MNNNTIAVIGGTGKSGKYLLNQLLKNHYRVRVLMRDPSKNPIDHSLAEIVQGDARDYQSVSTLLKNCHAVISTLGQPRGESSIFSQATQNVVKAMNNYAIDRYIVTTGLHVDTPLDQKDEKVQFSTRWMYDNFPEITRDKQVEHDFLVKCDVDWTLVRLPLIIQTDECFATEANLQNCVGEKISATDLASFLIGQLTDDTYVKKSPFLYNL